MKKDEEYYRKLIATVPGAVYEFCIDAAGNRSLPFISEGVTDLMGLSPAECMANVEVIFQQIPSTALPAMEESIRHSLQNLSFWSHAFPIRLTTGEDKWLRGRSMPQRKENGSTCWYGVLVDITQQKQTESALQDREEKLLLSMEIARMGTWDWDIVKNTLTYSRTVGPLFGLPPGAQHATAEEFIRTIHPEDRERVTRSFSLTLETGTMLYEEYRVIWPDGTVHWLTDHGRIKHDQTGKPIYMVGVAMDVSERRQVEQRIVEMATHDVLTGLPNRRLLQDRITQALAHGRRSQEKVAVLFIDLDHFKIINDSLGHVAGDLLLKEVAARLSAIIRSEDTVARHGGDEFIMLLPNITGPQDAVAVAQKILDELIQPFQIHGEELHIGGSIGIALFPDDGENVDTLLKNSDIAMYHAKESGRNNYQLFRRR